jgi:F420-non-reducing hydrogenase small subunit
MEKEAQKKKLKLAVYWGSACGGCCVSVLDLHEHLLQVLDKADLVFWPIAMDIKYSDLEKMPDGYIDVTLFNGAIRNSENELIAVQLRQKSKILVAYGSCAQLGGIPGLANLSSRNEILERVYLTSESTVNHDEILPEPVFSAWEGNLHIPMFYEEVKTLKDAVCVDYYIPGCPPQSERLLEVFTAIASGGPLPSKESVVGANIKSQCDECPRIRSENRKITHFYRPWEVEDDHVTCFLEQGILCMGPATRGGCGYRCIKVGAPCRGCYGPAPDVADQGAKMMSAIATMIDSNDPEEIREILGQLVDPAGTFYRFSVPASILRKKVTDPHQTKKIQHSQVNKQTSHHA